MFFDILTVKTQNKGSGGIMLDFKDLTYIVAIAKYQNITKAAESLFITQPTLSKFLQNMEKNLGQKLFRKLGNRFLLTYAGERYVSKAIEILNLKKELDQEMGDIIKNNAGSLKIAFPSMRGTYMLPCTLPIFHSLYPNVTLDILEANSGILEEKILNGEIDLAFLTCQSEVPISIMRSSAMKKCCWFCLPLILWPGQGYERRAADIRGWICTW